MSMPAQPQVTQTVVDSHIISSQRIEDRVTKLDYDYKRCCGCGVCVEMCPTDALELGDMRAIGTGLDVPPVLLDPDKCSFCGMCAAFCPVKAVKMEINGEDAAKRECYPHIAPKAQTNKNCLPCSLCEQVCSSDAITVRYTFPKKEEIAPFKKSFIKNGPPGGFCSDNPIDVDEEATGEIKIDTEKCNYCGICAYFCDAFILIPKERNEITPIDPVPFENILIDEERCDYCVLCEDICPEDAITVKGNREAVAPHVSGELLINDNCIACGWCKNVCPYEGIDIFKPFSGDIRLIENHLIKCDPLGCHACFNVCPSDAWYIPADGKIDVSADRCIFCGACEHACWLDAIAVDRTGVVHTPVCDTAWKEEWERGIASIVSKERERPDRSHIIAAPVPEREAAPVPAMPDIDPALLEKARARIDRIMPALHDVKTRYRWEGVRDS